MTLGTIILIVVIVGVFFLIMKKGGGCCGGHDQNAPPEHAHCEMEHHEGHHGAVTAKDPVCGMSVSDHSMTSEYQGKTYSFCSEHCRETFNSNPKNFVK